MVLVLHSSKVSRNSRLSRELRWRIPKREKWRRLIKKGGREWNKNMLCGREPWSENGRKIGKRRHLQPSDLQRLPNKEVLSSLRTMWEILQAK
jgi:hypothetical protein